MNPADNVTITTPSDREVVVSRTFDAPRTLVFDAYTQPELLQRWYGTPGRSLVVCEVDLRVGGAYRFLWRGPGKKDVGMRGVHREVVRPERLVRTETWEDWDAGEILETTVLTERNGVTTLTSTGLYPSRDIRDAVMKAGLESGSRETFARLAEMLASLKASKGAA
ncbi:MAG TPA: SRPBCC family protein [Steroidobacteraceae bacterium]|nr:SRPBCC family protein [Steroidobacteraceae bacterium]